jgi:hypothetical protein
MTGPGSFVTRIVRERPSETEIQAQCVCGARRPPCGRLRLGHRQNRLLCAWVVKGATQCTICSDSYGGSVGGCGAHGN